MLHTFSAVYLAIIVFALCTAVSRHASTAMELVPVRESHPDSTMYLWRPYTVYFVGDRHFDPLQRVVPRSENITQFDLYAQSYLNMVVYHFRERFHGCEVKLKVIGTRIFTAQEEELYLPKVVKDGQISVHLENVTFEEFFALNPEVDAADIVVFLTGQSLTGNAVSNGEPVLCYNTMNTCCLPLFYGIYNLRREPLCKRYNGREVASTDTDLDNEGGKYMCEFTCLEEKGHEVGGPAPVGTVKKATSEYWICNTYVSHHHHRTYKHFKKAVINAWELDDYEVPETDVTFCMQ
ncbi:uncharacterized protein LOC135375311 isoform X3 [Ornithodoros turicata]|uniref:uncharacterized protein LOC135375311 isoform X3 n=1 Tax=Ornithodoros turicata TaxID=34597 RepID=UPI003139403D